MSGDFLQIADNQTPQTGQGVPVSTSNPVPVSLVGGSSGPDRELVVTTYSAKNAFSGASAGDTITCVRVLDVSGPTPSTVATIWRNETTNTDLGGAPAAANLNLVGAGGASEATLGQVRDEIGAADSAQAASDDGNWNLNSLIKRVLLKLSGIGNPADPAAVNDTGNWALTSLFKRLLTKVPTLGQKDNAGSLPVALSSDGNWARENYFTGRIAANTGAAFPSTGCSMLDIHNTAQGAVDIQYQVGSTGEWMDIPAGYSDVVRGISNANQVAIRRTDGGAAVTVKAVLYAVSS